MLTIKNNGPEIEETNYFTSEYAYRGIVYLSINSGAFRLLVPESAEHYLVEMRTGKEVIVSRGPWPEKGKTEAIELVFEDHSSTPFSLHFGSEQIDRLPDDSDRGKEFVFSVWTMTGKKLELPGKYRKVKRIPWLKPWE